jgi:hypothetical protein
MPPADVASRWIRGTYNRILPTTEPRRATKTRARTVFGTLHDVVSRVKTVRANPYRGRSHICGSLGPSGPFAPLWDGQATEASAKRA